MQKTSRKLPLVLCVLTGIVLGPLLLLSTDASTRTETFLKVAAVLEGQWPFAKDSAAMNVWLPRLESVHFVGEADREIAPGVVMRLDPGDLIHQSIYLRGSWEPGTWEEMKELLPEGGTFIDVGAHHGYYSLKAARAMGPSGSVISIEPNPSAIARLETNRELSGLNDQITIVPVAVSDTAGTLDLFVNEAVNTGASSLSAENARSGAYEEGQLHSVPVPVARLDDILAGQNVQRVDLIKMDIEGAEFLALNGARQILEEFHPALILETGDDLLRNMGSSEAELRQWLDSAGYHEVGVRDENTVWRPKP